MAYSKHFFMLFLGFFICLVHIDLIFVGYNRNPVESFYIFWGIFAVVVSYLSTKEELRAYIAYFLIGFSLLFFYYDIYTKVDDFNEDYARLIRAFLISLIGFNSIASNFFKVLKFNKESCDKLLNFLFWSSLACLIIFCFKIPYYYEIVDINEGKSFANKPLSLTAYAILFTFCLLLLVLRHYALKAFKKNKNCVPYASFYVGAIFFMYCSYPYEIITFRTEYGYVGSYLYEKGMSMSNYIHFFHKLNKSSFQLMSIELKVFLFVFSLLTFQPLITMWTKKEPSSISKEDQ